MATSNLDLSASTLVVSDEHPYDHFLTVLRQRGSRIIVRGPTHARATCPAHQDTNPSLGVTKRSDRVLFRCFAGCTFGDVLRALGLRQHEMFVRGPRRSVGGACIVAAYEYKDLDGIPIAEKVRLEPKGFRWRTLRDGKKRWGLDGALPGLYRLGDLKGLRTVSCLEGEKAVDRFWQLGLPATCPPAGAGTWKPLWSRDLQSAGCRELLIFPDADRVGKAHAEAVAAATFALNTGTPKEEQMTIRLIPLPGLAPGEDAVDWLEAGHTPEELLDIALQTRPWVPGQIERERAARRRELSRERQRRFRERQRARFGPGGDVTL